MTPLTRSEEVCVRLAGEGLRNGAIATQLGVSERTVGNHLNRAYRKLGVNDRRAAAEKLLTSYSEQKVSIASGPDVAPDQGVTPDRISVSEDGEGERPWSLYQAYARLGALRTPPRWASARTALILLWTLIGLLTFSIVAGAVTLFGSADRTAAATYASAPPS